jgi:phosphoribosylformylglycinamidine synthase PurS subunit
MNATVIVTLKPTVLDPQGLTIHRSLTSLGFAGVEGVRQGKYFEVEVSDDLTPAERESLVERLAKEVLTNPVIESCRVVWGEA